MEKGFSVGIRVEQQRGQLALGDTEPGADLLGGPLQNAVDVLRGAVEELGHIVDNWPYYGARPDQLVAFWNGGVAVTAAPIGSAIGGSLYARDLLLTTGYVAAAFVALALMMVLVTRPKNLST